MIFITLDPNKPGELDRLAALSALLVRYHSPNCHHCVAMESEWKALKDHPKLKDKEITIIDVESSLTPEIKHKSARLPETQGVPTVVFIEGTKSKEHKGARSADAMAEFAVGEMKMGGGKRKRTKRKSRKKSKKIKSIKRKPIIKGTRNIRNKRLIIKKKRRTIKRRRNNKKRKTYRKRR